MDDATRTTRDPQIFDVEEEAPVRGASGVSMRPVGGQQVVLTDVQMPFSSMVMFILKWTIASIPATIILFLVFGLLFAVLGACAGIAGMNL